MSELSSVTEALLREARETRLPDIDALDGVQDELREKLERLESRPAPMMTRRALALAIVLLSLVAASSVAAYSLIRSYTQRQEEAPRPSRSEAPEGEGPAAARRSPDSAHHRVPVDQRLVVNEPAPPAAPPVVDAPPPAPRPAGPGAAAPRRSEPPRLAAPAAQEPSTPAPTIESDPPPPAQALIEETRLLRLAQSALRDHEPNRALGYLADHQRRFPEGTLSLERDAARLVARCQLGPSESLRRRAEQLIARSPGSIHTSRIRAACLARSQPVDSHQPASEK